MEVWDSCMKPSIVQIVQYMSTFFLWNIAFRLTSQTGECVCVHPNTDHRLLDFLNFISIPFDQRHNSWHRSRIQTSGIDCMRHSSALFLIGFGFIVQCRFHHHHLSLLHHNHTPAIAHVWHHVDFLLFGVTHNWVCSFISPYTHTKTHSKTDFDWNGLDFCSEILDTDVLTWHRMRGTQMIAAMKIISLGFDIDRAIINRPPRFLEFWGYVLCPGNVVMGPWSSYTEYLLIFERSKWVSDISTGNFNTNEFIAVSFSFPHFWTDTEMDVPRVLQYDSIDILLIGIKLSDQQLHSRFQFHVSVQRSFADDSLFSFR